MGDINGDFPLGFGPTPFQARCEALYGYMERHLAEILADDSGIYAIFVRTARHVASHLFDTGRLHDMFSFSNFHEASVFDKQLVQKFNHENIDLNYGWLD